MSDVKEKKIDYGLPIDTPCHQEYYKEPFTPIKDGFGFDGVLTVNNEETHSQCHICGRFYKQLGIHVNHSHKMTARDYKIKFGLRLTKGLVASRTNKVMSQRMHNESSLTKLKRLTGLKKGADKLNKDYHKYKPTQNYALENKNIKGTCPEQLLDKIRNVYSMYENHAGLNKFREVYGGGAIEAIYRTYGSWRHAVILAGYQVNSPKHPMTQEQFRALAIDFYDRWGSKPTYNDFKNRRDVPSHTVIYKLFGSYPDAMKYCFNNYPVKAGI